MTDSIHKKISKLVNLTHKIKLNGDLRCNIDCITCAHPTILFIGSDKNAIEETANTKTITITSSYEAIKILHKLKPSFIILDIHLPHEDTHSILNYIKKNESLQKVPIMISTKNNNVIKSS